MPSFGESLRRERELRQIPLREVAESTKINIRYLDALERNEFRHLPGGVFNKGFIRAYAQFIGIDPEAMVTSYLEEVKRQEESASQHENELARKRAGAAGAPARTRTEKTFSIPSRRLRAPLVAVLTALAALVLAGAAYVILKGVPSGLWRRGTRPAAETAAVDGPSADVSPTVAAPENAPATPGPAKRDDPSDRAGSTSAEGTATPSSPPSAPAPESNVSPAPSAPEPVWFDARIVLLRPADGSVACSESEATSLRSLPAPTILDLRCRGWVLIDTDDAGAIQLGIDGSAPQPVGADNIPVRRTYSPPRSAGGEEPVR